MVLVETNFEASKALFLKHFGASKLASTKARSLKHDFPVHGEIPNVGIPKSGIPKSGIPKPGFPQTGIPKVSPRHRFPKPGILIRRRGLRS